MSTIQNSKISNCLWFDNQAEQAALSIRNWGKLPGMGKRVMIYTKNPLVQ
jgi:hypothetical protein